MNRIFLAGLLTLLPLSNSRAGDDPKSVDAKCREIAKKLSAPLKLTEANLKPLAAEPDNVRVRFFETDLFLTEPNKLFLLNHFATKDPEDAVRLAAIGGLSKLGANKAATKTLTDLLGAKSSPIRLAAIVALGSHKDPAVPAKIAKLMSDESREVRLAAVKAIGLLNDRRQVPTLIAAFKKDGKGDDTDHPFAESLAMLGETKVSLGIAKICMESRDYKARLAAVRALELNPSMDVIPIYMKNMSYELRRTISLDSTKRNWDQIYVTICSDMQRRIGKNFGNDAVGWHDWWETVRAQYKAPPPAFPIETIERWLATYLKMNPSKVGE